MITGSLQILPIFIAKFDVNFHSEIGWVAWADRWISSNNTVIFLSHRCGDMMISQVSVAWNAVSEKLANGTMRYMRSKASLI